MLALSFDQKALSEIAAFAGFSLMLSDEVQTALHDAGSLLVQSAQGNMHWQNPTGALEESMGIVSESHFEVIAGSADSKARRRELGFSGMTDRLGRYYANDPGAFFLTDAMQEQQSVILQSVDDAANRAMARLGAV